MPENRARSYILPILLIVAGVALLLDQLGIWYLNWASVSRFWPLILVLVGLDIILRRARWGAAISLVLVVAFVALVLLFVLPEGPRERGLASEMLNYPAQGIKAANVRLEVGVGRLQVVPLKDSGNLYEAQIDYDKGRTTLTHDATVSGDTAHVELKGTQSGWVPFGRSSTDTWRVWLNPNVPVRLDIVAGVNRSDLDLTGIQLTRLNLNVGVGQTTAILSGEGAYEASINGGVGALTVEIPRGMEARIRIDSGVGAVEVDERFAREGKSKYYVSQGYATAKDKLDLDIDGGVGSIIVR